MNGSTLATENKEKDNLGKIFNEVLKTAFLEEFVHFFLESEDDLGNTENGVAVVGDNPEAAGIGHPSVLLIVVLLGYNDDFMCNEVGRVETDAKLTNHESYIINH